MSDTENKQPPQLSEADKLALNQIIRNKKLSLLQAEKILAQHELAEMTYKYAILQLYMKYGLTANDSITESGEIIINGNLQGTK